jgi:hypothetical protein
LTINVTDASGEWTPDGMAVAEVSGGWPGYDHANPEYMYQWDDLANQTNDSLLYVHGGEYTLTVTDQLGCTITKTVTVEPYIPYGINTLEGAGFTAYPNPSTSNLTITVKAEYMGSDLSIHSVNGQKIFSKVVDQSNINIDVTDINPGMYIIKLETNKGAHHQKLIVK